MSELWRHLILQVVHEVRLDIKISETRHHDNGPLIFISEGSSRAYRRCLLEWLIKRLKSLFFWCLLPDAKLIYLFRIIWRVKSLYFVGILVLNSWVFFLQFGLPLSRVGLARSKEKQFTFSMHSWLLEIRKPLELADYRLLCKRFKHGRTEVGLKARWCWVSSSEASMETNICFFLNSNLRRVGRLSCLRLIWGFLWSHCELVEGLKERILVLLITFRVLCFRF